MRFSLYWFCLKRLMRAPPSPIVFWNLFSYFLNRFFLRRTVLHFYPMSVVIYLTKRCNYKCSYCYAEPVLERSNAKTDLTLSQLKSLMDSPYGKRALRIGLLGGEPFLNKDIFSILAEIKRRRKIVTIVSNASLLKGDVLEELLRSDLDVLGLSLYPNNREHIARVVTAIRGKMKYWVQAVITPTSIGEMENIVNFCLAIGCENLHFSNCVPVPGSSDVPIYNDNQEYLAMERHLRSKYRSRGIHIDWVTTLPKAEKSPRACAMPFSYVHVDNEGSLGACCMRAPNRKLFGNIYEDPNAWNAPYYIKLRQTMLDASLEPLDLCRGCDNLHSDLYKI